jgi:hypothetical protein
MIEQTEVFALLISFVGFILLRSAFKTSFLPGQNHFFAAFVCLLLSQTFTVAEDLFLRDLLNHLEHLFLLAAAVIFFTAVRHLQQDPQI